jgi:hypothetical protein
MKLIYFNCYPAHFFNSPTVLKIWNTLQQNLIEFVWQRCKPHDALESNSSEGKNGDKLMKKEKKESSYVFFCLSVYLSIYISICLSI